MNESKDCSRLEKLLALEKESHIYNHNGDYENVSYKAKLKFGKISDGMVIEITLFTYTLDGCLKLMQTQTNDIKFSKFNSQTVESFDGKLHLSISKDTHNTQIECIFRLKSHEIINKKIRKPVSFVIDKMMHPSTYYEYLGNYYDTLLNKKINPVPIKSSVIKEYIVSARGIVKKIGNVVTEYKLKHFSDCDYWEKTSPFKYEEVKNKKFIIIKCGSIDVIVDVSAMIPYVGKKFRLLIGDDNEPMICL